MKRIFVLGGGTGGHIIPARCVAKELAQNSFEVHFFGDKKIANYVKTDDLFKTTIISSSQLKKAPLEITKAAILIAIGFFQSIFLLLRFRPIFVVAFGGYSSFPMLVASVLLRKKIILHEQNAHLGKVNRYFAPFASKIMTGFNKVDGIKNQWLDKVIYVGNPVRDEILSLQNQQYQPFELKYFDSNSSNQSLKPSEIKLENRSENFAAKMFFDEEFFDEFEDSDDFEEEFEIIKISNADKKAKNQFLDSKPKTRSEFLSSLDSSDDFSEESDEFSKNFQIRKLDEQERKSVEFNSKMVFEGIKSSFENDADFQVGFAESDNSASKKEDKKMGYDLLLASQFKSKTTKAEQLNQESKQLNSKKYFEILIYGGSGGAKIFSDIVPRAIFNLPNFIKNQIFIYQQCRQDLVESTAKQFQDFKIKAEVASFFENMPKRLANCDLIISRAGASSIAEFCIAKRPAILVPFASAADDHQAKNAQILANKDAVILLTEPEFTINRVQQLLNNLIANPLELKKIAENAQKLSNPNSAAEISAKIFDLCK